MGYNPSVQYQRGNYGLQTLVAERIAKWGKPARYSEYVTGYKSATNFSGHNPDSNGIVHAVDIFVGPGNLTPAQGVELYDAVRREGVRGNIDGHPKRVTYVIHNRTISGDFNQWTNAPYTGPDPHTDHVHISTADLYWGDGCGLNPDDYDSKLTWSLGSNPTIAKPQSGAITPIEEMDIDMATPDQVVDALLNRKITINGQEARFQDWFVAVVKDSGQALKSGQIVKSFDNTEAPVHQVLANLGADVRAIKTVTDGLKK